MSQGAARSRRRQYEPAATSIASRSALAGTARQPCQAPGRRVDPVSGFGSRPRVRTDPHGWAGLARPFAPSGELVRSWAGRVRSGWRADPVRC